MALPVTIPNEFANATASIPLSQLDTNFTTLANAVNGISDGSESLANVSVTGGTISNVAVSATTLNTSGQVVFNDAGADVDFRVEGDTDANLLFVDASADAIGIGTSSPGKKLDILSNTSQDGIRISGSSNPRLTIIDTTTPVQFDVLCTDTEVVLRSDTNHPMVLSTNGTERARITSAGAVEIANGNLVFSTNGTGIDFSASAGGGATSSLLDDYEEGTWTPGISFGGASAGVTFNSTTGNYVKIGQLLFINFRIDMSSKGSSSGVARITGSPFTFATSNTVGGSAGVSFSACDNLTFTANLICGAESNATTMAFARNVSGGPVVDITNTDFANNTVLRGNLVTRTLT
jgi:hypothetical protein